MSVIFRDLRYGAQVSVIFWYLRYRAQVSVIFRYLRYGAQVSIILGILDEVPKCRLYLSISDMGPQVSVIFRYLRYSAKCRLYLGISESKQINIQKDRNRLWSPSVTDRYLGVWGIMHNYMKYPSIVTSIVYMRQEPSLVSVILLMLR